MKTKAVLAGIGYRWHFDRFSAGPRLQAGFAFNSGSMEGDVDRAFETPRGTVSVEVANSPLLRSQLNAEYFVAEKVSIRATADYILTRPDVTVITPHEQLVDRWDAGNVHATIGVSFYPFRN